MLIKPPSPLPPPTEAKGPLELQSNIVSQYATMFTFYVDLYISHLHVVLRNGQLLHYIYYITLLHGHIPIKFTRISGESRGDSGVSLEPPSPPHPPFLNILWKWNNLVSVRPNYFIFMGYGKGSLTVWALYTYFSDSQNAAFELLVWCM